MSISLNISREQLENSKLISIPSMQDLVRDHIKKEGEKMKKEAMKVFPELSAYYYLGGAGCRLEQDGGC